MHPYNRDLSIFAVAWLSDPSRRAPLLWCELEPQAPLFIDGLLSAVRLAALFVAPAVAYGMLLVAWGGVR